MLPSTHANMDKPVSPTTSRDQPPEYDHAKELGLTAEAACEVKRLQTFLAWILVRRYTVKLPSEQRPRPDKRHFLRLGQLLDRYNEGRCGQVDSHEVDYEEGIPEMELLEYHAIRTKYLDDPANVIGISPVWVRTMVLQYIWRLAPWRPFLRDRIDLQSFYGDSVDDFAQRMIMDRDELIPAVVAVDLRTAFFTAYRKIETWYFKDLTAAEFRLTPGASWFWKHQMKIHEDFQFWLQNFGPLSRWVAEVMVAFSEESDGEAVTPGIGSFGHLPSAGQPESLYLKFARYLKGIYRYRDLIA